MLLEQHNPLLPIKDVYPLSSFVKCFNVDNDSIVILQHIANQIPHLVILVGTDGGIWLASEDVNQEAEGFDLYHSYEECSSTPVIVYLWKKIDGVKIYSLPHQFEIGKHNVCGYGDCPDINWKNILESGQINLDVINRIELYFQRHPPQDK